MKQHLDDLKEIRQLMERSSKFLSLSGLSGISVGILALISAAIIYFKNYYINEEIYRITNGLSRRVSSDKINFLAIVALVTLLIALLIGVYFTLRKAKKNKQKVWNSQSKKMLTYMSIPLFVGGILGIALMQNGIIWPLSGITLLFYGLSLINASHYTYRDVFYLGLLETALGLVALFWVSYSLLFWAIGFGFLHIIYGSIMYFKYDK